MDQKMQPVGAEVKRYFIKEESLTEFKFGAEQDFENDIYFQNGKAILLFL